MIAAVIKCSLIIKLEYLEIFKNIQKHSEIFKNT